MPLRMPSSRARTPGFTLIELLIVIAIVMVLASIMLVVGYRARLNARAAFCANNMRQIGMALAMRADRGLPRSWCYVGKALHPDDPILLCPQGPQDGVTNYGLNQYLVGKPVQAFDTGETVLLYESKRAGEDLIGDARDVDLRHSGAGNFVFLDGHVERLSRTPPFRP
jgi:prepilin-type processing-associated H-X9-DG protein/prepilin-type N-terminal cleavage/methylation domain-containing protein